MSESPEGKDDSSLLGLPKATTPGDIGAAGLGLAVGYFIGISLLYRHPNSGLTPGSVAVYLSAGALGIKNTVQALMGVVRERVLSARTDALSRAKKLDEEIAREIAIPLPEKEYKNERRMRELLAAKYRQDLLAKVEQRKALLITDDNLEDQIKATLDHWKETVEIRKEAEDRR